MFTGLNPGCTHTAQTEAVMRARIALAVEEANTAYALSGIDLVLRAVHTYRETTGYVEYLDPSKSSIGSTALRDVATDGDNLMDSVHFKRTQYGADMVALIVNYEGGVAYRNTPTASISSQFSVMGWAKATGRFTFAHELGKSSCCRTLCNMSIPSFFFIHLYLSALSLIYALIHTQATTWGVTMTRERRTRVAHPILTIVTATPRHDFVP